MKTLTLILVFCSTSLWAQEKLDADAFKSAIDRFNVDEVSWEHEKKDYSIDPNGRQNCGVFCDDTYKNLIVLANNMQQIADEIVHAQTGSGLNSVSVQDTLKKGDLTSKEFQSFYEANKHIIEPYPNLWKTVQTLSATKTLPDPKEEEAKQQLIYLVKENAQMVKDYKILTTFKDQVASMNKFKCDLKILSDMCSIPVSKELEAKILSVATDKEECNSCSNYFQTFKFFLNKIYTPAGTSISSVIKYGSGYIMGTSSIEPFGPREEYYFKNKDDMKLIMCHLVQYQEGGDCGGIEGGQEMYTSVLKSILVNQDIDGLTIEDCRKHGLMKNKESSVLPLVKSTNILTKAPYPNPIQNELNVEFDPGFSGQMSKVEFALFDLKGNQLTLPESTNITGTTVRFNFSQVNSGQYYLKVIHHKSDLNKMFKIVKP